MMTVRLVVPLLLAVSAGLFGGNSGSTVTLNSSPNPSVFGRTVTLTAGVNPPAATGTVTFYDGATVLGTGKLTAGHATLTTNFLPALANRLTAYYGGDATYAASKSATVAQTVNAVTGGEFQFTGNYGAGVQPVFVAVGDFDGDGKADVVAANNNFGSNSIGMVNVLLGNGNGTFKPAVSYSVGGNAVAVAVEDLNGDGKPDLIVCNFDNYVSVLVGHGDGTFAAAVNYQLPQALAALAVGDFDGDGKADLAVTDYGGSVRVLLGNGDGTFGSPINTPGAGAYPISVAVGDFNADGKPDLAVTDWTGQSVNILLGKGDGTFNAPVSYGTGSFPRFVAIGDFNGDGTADLVVANQNSSNVSVLLGNPNGTFQAAVNYGAGPNPLGVAVGDWNGDGKPDLAVVNFNARTVNVLLGSGNGVFPTAFPYTIDWSPFHLAVGDFNGDGRPDLVTVNNGDADVSVLLNLPPAPDLTVQLTHSGDFDQGLNAQFGGGPVYTITVSNVGTLATSGLVTVTDHLPAGVSVVSISGPGWACDMASVTCTTSDPLAPDGKYPDITLSVRIAAGVPGGLTNNVAVSGGGETNGANDVASDFANTFTQNQYMAAWTPVPLPAGLDKASAAFLMTDGSVMVQRYCAGNWFKLTPDLFGNYATGTWSQAASLPAGYAPYAYASALLPDGRLVVTGGEYNGSNGSCGGIVDTTLGAVYDPKANAWTALAPPTGWNRIGDASSVILPNGQFLLGASYNPGCCQTASLNAATLTWTILPDTGKADSNEEEGWTLLPDGSVLTVDVTTVPGSERYLPQSGTWVSAGNTPVPLSAGNEIGPQVLRPDGTVFVAGMTGHTGIYNSGTGTWAAGPDFPIQNTSQLTVGDTAAVLMPNGNVLVSQGQGFYFEFDGTVLSLTPGPPGQNPCLALLPLPNGQILCSNDVESVYTPSGSANPAWAPTITSAPSTLQPGQTYTISGRQFNGLSQAVAFGDDYQGATNYPLARIVNNATGHVFYCRTHDHSSMGVATGSLTVSTRIDVPASTETGPATLVVVTNGIPSQPFSVTIGGQVSHPGGVPNDFAGTGRSGALLYDPNNGQEYTALSNGSGSYSYVPNLVTSGFDTLRTGDFNGDGKTDLVVYNSHTALAYIGFSNGDGTFAFQSLFWSSGYNFVETGDLNGDGKTDFVLYNSATGTMYTGISNGTGTFTYKYTLVTSGYTFLKLADFTGDGKADIFLYNVATGQANLGVGDGTGGFAFHALFMSPGYNLADVGDLNGDGKMDIIVYNSSNGNTATGISDGAGGFTFAPLLFSSGFTSVRLADYTGDGKADVTVYNKNNAAAYFGTGNGAGNFAFQSLFWSPGYDLVIAQDVNGDGKSDVVLYNSGTGTEYTGISNGAGGFTYTYSLWGPGKVVAR